jgi:hypothetical protein
MSGSELVSSESISRICPTARDFIASLVLIGIIMLVGIVKKNAIMMIDFGIAAQRECRSPSVSGQAATRGGRWDSPWWAA